ncbi:acyltransferase [Chitinophaga sancti]|uniref:acyltransferase n=1 Tax=Chitinophaga sancti TaxID=1004 RepID=UPI003F78C588
MKKLIEYFIQLRNPKFQFDPSVTNAEVGIFFGKQLMAVIRGGRMLFMGRNPQYMMLGKGVNFSFLNKIRWGKFLKLGDYVQVSGLGKKGISFGDNVGIGAFSRLIVATSFNNIGNYIVIGSNVGIGEFAYLGGAGGLSIGNDCIVGQYFSCHPENHIYADPDIPIRHQGVERLGITIEDNCWIGSKVTILDGVTIGRGCVIAAGAVVTRSFPPGVVIGGIPARVLRHRNMEMKVNAIA